MNRYNYDFMMNDYNNEEEDESPMDNNNEQNDLNNEQNNEEMFGVVDEINQEIARADKNLHETKKKRMMYEQMNKENLMRLNKNRINSYNEINDLEDIFDNNKKYQFSTPSRVYEPNFNISSDINDNYLYNKTFNDYNNHNNIQEKLNSKNIYGAKSYPELNNNENQIKNGIIKKSNKNQTNEIDDLNHNTENFLSENSSDNINQINLSKGDVEQLIKEFNQLQIKYSNLLKTNKILQNSLNKERNNFSKEIKTKEIKISELTKQKQNSKDPDLNNSKSAKIRGKITYKEFEALQNDYDDKFRENTKLKEDLKKQDEELEKYKKEKEEYKQSIIDMKKMSEENYQMKGQIISLNNDNVILFNKMKKYDEDKDKVKQYEKELKTKISDLNIDNRNKEEKIKELMDIIEKNEIKNNNIEEKKIKEKEQINVLKKELDSLKLKCVNYEKLVIANEKLNLSLQEKEDEIKNLNAKIEELNKPKKEEINSENNNNSNQQLKEKDNIIQTLKEEKSELENKLNNTRLKLTDFEGKLETKKLIIKKYYEDKKDLEKFKEEKKEVYETIKNLRDKNNDLEKKVRNLRKTIEDERKKRDKENSDK